MLLLRYCHAHCLCHLLRNIPLDELRSATIIHDTLLNINDMTAGAWPQAVFSVRYGCVGMTSATQLSPIAFVSGWVNSLQVLPDRFPDLQPQVASVISQTMSPSAQEDSIDHHLQQCVCPGQALTDPVFNTKRLQHKVTEKQTKSQVQYIIDNSSIKDAARLRSLQGKCSGA